MSGKSKIILATALSVALLSSSSLGAPKISVSGKDVMDFGKYPANKRKEAVFKLVNDGDRELKITKIRKTCGCAEAACDKLNLKAGESTDLKAVILGDSIYDGYSKNVYVESNDPNKRFLKLTLAGNAVPIAKIKPKDKIYAGRVDVNSFLEKSFILTPTQKGVELGEPFVECNYPAKATMVASPDGGGKVVLKVFLENSKGDMKATVKTPVLKPKGWAPLKMIVTAKIGTEFIAVPEKTYFPIISAKPVRKTFQLRFLGLGDRIDAGAIKWTAEGVAENSLEFKFGKVGKNTIPVTGIFKPGFVNALATKGVIEILFQYPGASPAKLTCESN